VDGLCRLEDIGAGAGPEAGKIGDGDHRFSAQLSTPFTHALADRLIGGAARTAKNANQHAWQRGARTCLRDAHPQH
jgi:hypothetical protein